MDEEGNFIVNPKFEEAAASDLDLLVSGTRDRINMIEDESNEIPVEKMIEAMEFAFKEVQRLCDIIDGIRNDIGKEKMDYVRPEELAHKCKAKIDTIRSKRFLMMVNLEIDRAEKAEELKPLKAQLADAKKVLAKERAEVEKLEKSFFPANN